MLKKVKIFDKYNYIEDDKKLLSNTWFDKVGEFKNDLAYVYKEGSGYNFLNKDGKLLSETFFKNINEFNDKFITNVILPNGELGNVNNKGILFDKNKNKITEKIAFNKKTEVENFVNGVFETAISFEDSIILEKRSHPETNIDLDFTEYLNKLLGKYKIEDVFVSFRRTEQVSDINPNNEYYTPSGFYSYPLKNYLTSSNINYDNFIKLFPFTGGDFKYIYFFVLNKKENVLDNKTTVDEIKHFVNNIKTIYESFDGIETICDQFFNDKYYLHGVENKLERFWYFLNDVYKYTYAGKNKQNSIYKICYNIGLDGVIDNGLGFIHKNEPIQAVFFKVKNIGELFYFKKKDIDKGSILTAVENGESFENLRPKYKFLSLKSAREFTNKYPNEKIFFKGIYNEIYFSKDFDHVSNFEDAISIVELKNKFNIIDLNGKLLFNNWFDDVIKQDNNLFKIEDNNEFNFITFDNKLLNNEWFDYAGDFFQGYSRVNKNSKWNLLDTEGELLSNDWFDEISEMRYGRVKFKINGMEGIIDHNGNIITNKMLNNENMNKKIKITKKQLNEVKERLVEEQIEGMIKLPNFILNSIKDGRTSLGKHPSFPPEDEKRFEEKILLKRFMELGKSLAKINDLQQHDKQTLTNKLSEYVRKAIIIETPLRKELEKLCYDFVCGQFDLTPGELDITCELKDRIEPEKLPNVEPMLLDDTEFDDITSIDNLGKEIYKRRLINSLIQGASVRLSSEFNKIVSDLYELNPSLIELYHNILIINEYLSFIKEVKPDNKNLGGFVSVDLSNPEPKISSEAVIFPVLVFETVKGIMELVASHGLPKNRRESEYVIGKADFSLAENWDKRFGVGLYDLFSKNIENKKLQTEIFAEFVELEPERFFIKTKEVFANTKKGKEFITNLEKYITRSRGFDDIDKAIGVNNNDFNTFDVNTGGNDTDFYFEREDFNLGVDAGGYFHVDELGGLITDSVTTSSAGDYTYDVPLFGDEETLNHKDMIKNSQAKWNVREEDEKLIDEMAYPASFNMGEFKNIRSFAGRVAYCRKHLTRLAEGSSRMVFKIDDEKVLKLAKNRKGLGQNESEARMGYSEGYFTCIAHVFDYDDNYMFVEMELAKKCSKQDFQRITGYDFETFVKYLEAESNGDLRKEFSQEFIDEDYDNSSIMTEVSEFVRTYELPLGDIYRFGHYGVVKRKGEEYVVLIDYGLTSDVYEKYY